MSKVVCGVYDTAIGEMIATVLMDEEIKDESIVDPNTLRLSPFKRGNNMTLLPADEDVRTTSVRQLKMAYDNVTKIGAPFFSTSIGRIDDLIVAVRNIFEDIELIDIEKREDLEAIINRDTSYEHKKAKFSVFEDYKEVIGDTISLGTISLHASQ